MDRYATTISPVVMTVTRKTMFLLRNSILYSVKRIVSIVIHIAWAPNVFGFEPSEDSGQT